MSKWAQYRVEEPSNKWAQYRVATPEPEQSTPEVVGKSLASGVVGLVDIPQNVGFLLEKYGFGPEYGVYGQARKLYDWYKDKKHVPLRGPEYIQKLPPNIASSYLKEGIKDVTGIDITPKPTTAAQRILGKGAEMAASFTPLGRLSTIDRLKKTAKAAGAGAAVGSASGSLQEIGVDPIAADIVSLGAYPVATSLARSSIPRRMLGLTPERMDLKAAKAAQDLKVDLPAAALTDSTTTALADQWIGKVFFYGDKLRSKYAKTKEQVAKVLEDIYEKTGPVRTPEVEARIHNLYSQRIKNLPEDATVLPTATMKAIDKIKIDSALLSSDEKNLLNHIKTLQNEFRPEIVASTGTIRLPLQQVGVGRLADTKRSINSIIKWDVDEGVKNLLRNIQKGLSDDIATYGKTNPKWYKTFKDADDLFSKVARREKLEKMLSEKSLNYGTTNLSYNKLAKTINEPRTRKIIKSQVTPEVFAKIDKLGSVSQAMAKKMQRVPNPSGTATTAATIAIIGGLYKNPLMFLSGSGMGAIGGAHVLSDLLTDKKFLDNAIKIASHPERHNIAAHMALNNRIKTITGYSAIALNNIMNDYINQEDEDVAE